MGVRLRKLPGKKEECHAGDKLSLTLDGRLQMMTGDRLVTKRYMEKVLLIINESDVPARYYLLKLSVFSLVKCLNSV